MHCFYIRQMNFYFFWTGRRKNVSFVHQIKKSWQMKKTASYCIYINEIFFTCVLFRLDENYVSVQKELMAVRKRLLFLMGWKKFFLRRKEKKKNEEDFSSINISNLEKCLAMLVLIADITATASNLATWKARKVVWNNVGTQGWQWLSNLLESWF